MALARKYRLSDPGQIGRVFKQGKTVKNSFFFVRYLPNHLTWARAQVLVPLKVSAKAVLRNRFKKQISQIIGQSIEALPAIDLVVTLTGDIIRKDHQEIKRELKEALNKIFVN